MPTNPTDDVIRSLEARIAELEECVRVRVTVEVIEP